eukprot:SAG31_NODE_45146_length_260_cov_0.633540_1_plen_34_part_10
MPIRESADQDTQAYCVRYACPGMGWQETSASFAV